MRGSAHNKIRYRRDELFVLAVTDREMHAYRLEEFYHVARDFADFASRFRAGVTLVQRQPKSQ